MRELTLHARAHDIAQPKAEARKPPLVRVLLGVPAYAMLNLGLIRILLSVTALPLVLRRLLGFGFVAFFSSWASGFVEMRSMLLAAARGQVLMPDMVPNMDWFSQLRMPRWSPPGWLFPVMWLLISKPTQVAACMRLASTTSLKWPFVLWSAHLCVGDAWNEVFFNRQLVGVGAATITIFFAMLLITAAAFYVLDPLAGLLMLPTCVWVALATTLNLSIWALNRDKPELQE